MNFVLILGILFSGSLSFADVSNIDQIESGAAFQLGTENSQANYYDQFHYEIVGNCKKIETVWFYSTSSWDYAQLGIDVKNRPVLAGVAIQFFRDGTYWAEYDEKAIVEVKPSSTVFEVLAYKILTGNWRVTGDQIEVGGIGVGKPMKLIAPSGKTVDGIKFQFTSVLNDKRAMNALTNVGRVGTNNGPLGVSINKYCGVTQSR